MASGNLSPRQKMINMMYLVLTALLALNISKDILQALTKLDASLEQTVLTVEQKNAGIYSAFELAYAEDAEKTREWRQKALEVKQESDELYKTIQDMKEELVAISGGYVPGTNVPKELDQREKPANYLLNQENASRLKEKIEAYRDKVKQYTSSQQFRANIESEFSTADQPVGEDETMASWEKANFEHYPLAAILPILTDYQAKIRNTESSIISELQENIDASDLKFTDVKVIVDPKSSYVTQGDEYQAEVFLAAYDRTQQPQIIVNGEPLSPDQISEGKGIIKFPASGVGEKKWGGKIVISQLGKGEVTYDIPEQTFTVAPPSVVISPTKMNVLYRGVNNPIEIGVPGVDPNKIRVSGPGISGSGGDYMANVSNVSSSEISINVSVEETNEEGNTATRSVGSKVFRIKDLPPAVGTILRRNSGQLSAGLIKSSPVEATLENFPFDLNLTVTGFEVVIPGFPPERVSGNTMPSAVKTRIDQMRPGQTITIRDIRATANGVRVPKVATISIDVN